MYVKKKRVFAKIYILHIFIKKTNCEIKPVVASKEIAPKLTGNLANAEPLGNNYHGLTEMYKIYIL